MKAQNHFDATIICDTLQEAVRFGMENQQFAIYDLNEGKQIDLVKNDVVA